MRMGFAPNWQISNDWNAWDFLSFWMKVVGQVASLSWNQQWHWDQGTECVGQVSCLAWPSRRKIPAVGWFTHEPYTSVCPTCMDVKCSTLSLLFSHHQCAREVITISKVSKQEEHRPTCVLLELTADSSPLIITCPERSHDAQLFLTSSKQAGTMKHQQSFIGTKSTRGASMWASKLKDEPRSDLTGRDYVF